MSWTKEEIKEMTGVLMRRAHGDGRDRQEVETICLLAETSIMNRESCERLMDKVEELKTDHAAEVERLVEQHKTLQADFITQIDKAQQESLALAERIRVLEGAIRTHKAKIEAGREDAMDIDFALWEVLVQPQQKEKGGKP